MSKKFIFIIISLILLSCKVKEPLKHLEVKKTFAFPFEWVGHYKGTLSIYKNNNEDSKIDMELIIKYPNAEGFYPWILIYNTEDIREYGLEAINPENGHYRIDEYNSIQIDGFLNDGHFISRFNVMGSDLLVDYCRTETGMDISFYITSSVESRTTGNEIIGSDTIPEVKSYPVQVFQKAILELVE